MIDKEKGFPIIADLVVSKKKHQDYLRVCELKNKYYKPLFTGENIEPLLKQFNLREDDKLFEQRKRLTQVVTPAICNTLLSPQRKVPSVRPVINTAEYKTKDVERETALWKEIQNFYGNKDVDFYMNEKFITLGNIDPNAFILTTFENFDNRYEKADVFAVEICCEDAWNFQYQNNQLQWLEVHKNIKYVLPEKDKDGNPKTKKGDYFILYIDKDQIEFTQINSLAFELLDAKKLYNEDKEVVDINATTINGTYYFKAGRDEVYKVKFYEQKSMMVQAFRVGYLPDLETDGRTKVSFIHPALPYLLKSIKSVSEMDLTVSLHAFPQKFTYQPKCAAPGCTAGYLPDGAKCGQCDESGLSKLHKSSQDHVSLAMPRNPDQLLDLSKIAFYLAMPEGTVRWMDEYVDKLSKQCLGACFNSDRFTANSFSKTATGEMIDMQSVYDALQPLSEHYSFGRTYIVKLIAIFKDLDNNKDNPLIVVHKFPRNFRFDSLSDLLDRLKIASDANASEAIIREINNEVAEQLYLDNPVALKEIRTRQLFNPFEGKTEDTIRFIISNGLATEYDKILWSENKSIISEAEDRSKDISFYDLKFSDQQKLIDTIVQEYIDEIKLDTPEPANPIIDFGQQAAA